ncbi:MAG: hypothetical protein M1817_003147 [Caeruleum heppii]|nr:MAG: hypothetical protein M1817_003147 [Caeruleum heppii]
MAVFSSYGLSTWHSRPAIVALLAVVLIYFIVNSIRYRRQFKHFLCQAKPPHSLLLGNIPALVKTSMSLPLDIHPHILFTTIQKEYNLPDAFVVDMWPISRFPQLVVTDPVAMKHFTQKQYLPKHIFIHNFVGHIIGPNSMLTTEDEAWKRSRSLFNPGFANAHLMTLVGAIVDDTLVFCEKLGEFADRQELCLLEEEATRLTIDIIGRVVLDANLNSQRTENELVTLFRRAISWTPSFNELNPFNHWNPIRMIVTRVLARRMDAYLGRVIDARIAAHDPSSGTTQTRRKPAIDLAIDEYLDQQQTKPSSSSSTPFTAQTFKREAIDNMKTFIFAGHDTTSSSICYVYHLLSRHPKCLARVRAEHDTLFGSDPLQAADKIRQQPHLLNQLPYTLAIIKETLRLFPPADPARQGMKGATLPPSPSHPHPIPTEPYLVLFNIHGMHHSATHYPSPETFSPVRFLPPSQRDDPSCPQGDVEISPDAWRPFERAPRACIGQDLAMIELRVIMVLTLRLFDIEAAYEEWDREQERKGKGKSGGGGGVNTVNGERAYQMLIASAKPAAQMPARVRRRKV